MIGHRAQALAVSVLLLIGLLGCQTASVPPAATVPPEAATPQAEPTGDLVIVIPEDPPSFNAMVADSGYDALVMHLTLLGMTTIDPAGKVYPVLAAELPTVDNGGVVIDEDSGTMDVTWKMRTTSSGRTARR